MLPLVFAVLSLFQSLPLGGIPISGGGGGGGAVFKGESHANQDASASSIATPGTLSIASGDLVVVLVGWQIGSGQTTPSSVVCGSDSLVNAKQSTEPGQYTISLFYKQNASANASATCTVTWSSAQTFSTIVAANWSGVATSNALLNTSCNSTGCNALASSGTGRTAQNVTTTTANALLIGCGINWDGNDVVSAANGFAARVNGITSFLLDKNVSATGTYPSGNFGTAASAQQYMSLFASFATL